MQPARPSPFSARVNAYRLVLNNNLSALTLFTLRSMQLFQLGRSSHELANIPVPRQSSFDGPAWCRVHTAHFAQLYMSWSMHDGGARR